ETFDSFGLRLAERNGCSSFESQVRQCIGSVWHRMPQSDRRRLLTSLNRTPDVILTHFPPRPSGSQFIGDHSVEATRQTVWRFCSSCIADDLVNRDGPAESRPYLRDWFACTDIGSCPKHRVTLL